MLPAAISKLWPCLAALSAGAALTAAFAPHDLWWLALAAPAVLLGLWSRARSPREGAWLGFLFGLGLSFGLTRRPPPR